MADRRVGGKRNKTQNKEKKIKPPKAVQKKRVFTEFEKKLGGRWENSL